MRVIFLDMDGVLNNPSCWGKRPLETKAIDATMVELFSALCERHDLKVVMSTSWRYQFTVDDFRTMLGRKGFKAPERIIGMTPHGDTDEYRGNEITAWLKDRDDVEMYVILDDMGIRSFEGHGRHLVQTAGSIGLTLGDVRMVEHLLKRGR